jgi:hypothetical protein
LLCAGKVSAPNSTAGFREAIELRLEVEGVPGNYLEFVGIQRVVIAA